MQTTIKICGLSTSEAVDTALGSGADMIGFIFFEKSPRHLKLETARALSETVGNNAQKVAVSVNAADAYLDRIIDLVEPHFLQLHGSESPERCSELRKKYKLPVIKAFAIRNVTDLDRLKPYEGIVERFLLDAKAPEGSQLPGGNGVSFDWNLLGSMNTQTPWMLSGGLDSNNIVDALEISGATAIDVSSGVESSPGIKDIAKIRAFIKTVRTHEKTRPGYSAAV